MSYSFSFFPNPVVERVGLYLIKFSKMSFEKINEKALLCMPNLDCLYLSENLLSSLKTNHFIGLSKLRVLSLSGNKISSIETKSFENLPRLKFLDLDRNQLTEIYEDDFPGICHLRDLMLFSNSISKTEWKAFEK